MNKPRRNEAKQITIGELCEALAKGIIPSQVENDNYVVHRRDIKRMAQAKAAPMPLPEKKTASLVVVA
jgi:hypothetical protein